MAQHFFLSGTDTDVGKTLVACALLHAAKDSGYSTLGLKPVAAGCEQVQGVWRNSDALALIKASTVRLDYTAVNPIALPDAIAPHIAAEKVGVLISASRLANQCQQVLSKEPWIIVEGAGGWRVPLNDSETMADLAKALELPVILVVGFKLGCLNQALLTIEAINNDGLRVAGWVANQIDPDMAVIQENLEALKTMIKAPCLGFIPYQSSPSPKVAAKFLDIDKLSG